MNQKTKKTKGEELYIYRGLGYLQLLSECDYTETLSVLAPADSIKKGKLLSSSLFSFTMGCVGLNHAHLGLSDQHLLQGYGVLQMQKLLMRNQAVTLKERSERRFGEFNHPMKHVEWLVAGQKDQLISIDPSMESKLANPTFIGPGGSMIVVPIYVVSTQKPEYVSRAGLEGGMLFLDEDDAKRYHASPGESLVMMRELANPNYRKFFNANGEIIVPETRATGAKLLIQSSVDRTEELLELCGKLASVPSKDIIFSEKNTLKKNMDYSKKERDHAFECRALFKNPNFVADITDIYIALRQTCDPKDPLNMISFEEIMAIYHQKKNEERANSVNLSYTARAIEALSDLLYKSDSPPVLNDDEEELLFEKFESYYSARKLIDEVGRNIEGDQLNSMLQPEAACRPEEYEFAIDYLERKIKEQKVMADQNDAMALSFGRTLEKDMHAWIKTFNKSMNKNLTIDDLRKYRTKNDKGIIGFLNRHTIKEVNEGKLIDNLVYRKLISEAHRLDQVPGKIICLDQANKQLQISIKERENRKMVLAHKLATKRANFNTATDNSSAKEIEMDSMPSRKEDALAKHSKP